MRAGWPTARAAGDPGQEQGSWALPGPSRPAPPSRCRGWTPPTPGSWTVHSPGATMAGVIEIPILNRGAGIRVGPIDCGARRASPDRRLSGPIPCTSELGDNRTEQSPSPFPACLRASASPRSDHRPAPSDAPPTRRTTRRHEPPLAFHLRPRAGSQRDVRVVGLSVELDWGAFDRDRDDGVLGTR